MSITFAQSINRTLLFAGAAMSRDREMPSARVSLAGSLRCELIKSQNYIIHTYLLQSN